MARPRSEEARREAIGAAVDLMCEQGVERLTIEDVAARSGVAKTTIYRHWPSRSCLIVDAVRSVSPHLATPDTGSLRDDLVSLFDHFVRADLSGPSGRIFPSLLAAAACDPDIDRLARELMEDRARPVRAVLERGKERGELGDVDLDVAAAIVVGPLVFQRVHRRRPVSRKMLETCVDVALAGLRAVIPVG